MWSIRSLIRAAEEVLARPDTTIQLRTIAEHQTTAKCSYGWSQGRARRVRLVIDPAKGGLIECALHEALHVVVHEGGVTQFNGKLDETVVKALERELWIKFRPATTRRWRRLINAKLRAS